MDSNLYQTINQLLSDLTVAQRDIQILHWNIKTTSFIYLHEYLGEVYNTLLEYIDIAAEQIRFQDAYPKATLTETISETRIKEVQSSHPYSFDEAVQITLSLIDYLKKLTDQIITYADDHQQWDVVDTFSAQSAHYAKILYFLKNSLTY